MSSVSRRSERGMTLSVSQSFLDLLLILRPLREIGDNLQPLPLPIRRTLAAP